MDLKPLGRIIRGGFRETVNADGGRRRTSRDVLTDGSSVAPLGLGKSRACESHGLKPGAIIKFRRRTAPPYLRTMPDGAAAPRLPLTPLTLQHFNPFNLHTCSQCLPLQPQHPSTAVNPARNKKGSRPEGRDPCPHVLWNAYPNRHPPAVPEIEDPGSDFIATRGRTSQRLRSSWW